MALRASQHAQSVSGKVSLIYGWHQCGAVCVGDSGRAYIAVVPERVELRLVVWHKIDLSVPSRVVAEGVEWQVS
jgi:hypothetical protein